jgi:hypothetical protein
MAKIREEIKVKENIVIKNDNEKKEKEKTI